MLIYFIYLYSYPSFLEGKKQKKRNNYDLKRDITFLFHVLKLS